MKVSISWIFDHIDADWKKQDIKNLVARFNQVVAEVESFEKISFDLSPYALGTISKQTKKEATIEVAEWNTQITLPSRTRKHTYLVKKLDDTIRWATCEDFGLHKEGALPAFEVPKTERGGGWKKTFECDDVILDVDNKSITHRPDMWGHRGFAREIAAFLNLPLKPEKEFIAKLTVQNNQSSSSATTHNPISIQIKAPKACARFAGIYFDKITNKPSNLFIASRLLKTEVRPLSGIIDATNYAMLDWGHPLHAYDADNIENKLIIARMANAKEKLTLLDESELTLTNQDLIIADAKKPLCLGGVMGGLYDSIEQKTTKVFLEAAYFDPAHVRRTALRHKVRTESSARFEKTLDPNQVPLVIARFVKLCKQMGIRTKHGKEIISVGTEQTPITLTILHSFFEKRAGVVFDKTDIINPLTVRGFTVKAKKGKTDITYTITIPTFRSTKDVQIKEDVLEEVVRAFGFEKIPLVFPAITKQPRPMTGLFRQRKIKEFLARSARMMEQQNYILFDEKFLQQVDLKFNNCLEITNPVSENNYRLVSTLMPNLFKNIHDNFHHADSLRFFELGRRWINHRADIDERKTIAGIFFEKRKSLDFYECKQHITDLLTLCGMKDGVEWKQISKQIPEFPWKMPHQSAEIFFEKTRIGVAGKVDTTFLSKLDALQESDAFFFELEADRLISHEAERTEFCPLSKYQGTTFDLSFMIPLTLTTKHLQETLSDSHDLIEKVVLIDFFEKEEWGEQRSLAFRIWISDPAQTIKKEDSQDAREEAIRAATALGAQLRG